MPSISLANAGDVAFIVMSLVWFVMCVRGAMVNGPEPTVRFHRPFKVLVAVAGAGASWCLILATTYAFLTAI